MSRTVVILDFTLTWELFWFHLKSELLTPLNMGGELFWISAEMGFQNRADLGSMAPIFLGGKVILVSIC